MAKIFSTAGLTGIVSTQIKTRVFKNLAVTEDESTRKSYLGTAVYSNFEVKPFNYEDLSGKTIFINNGIIIDTVLFSVSMSKNIVTTPIQGRNGTVKEYISDGDYNISIEGKIVNKSNNYPTKEVQEFIQILSAPVAIKIISDFLSFFGIHETVVESFDFPQTEGVRNEQEFSISLLSDTPVELITNEF